MQQSALKCNLNDHRIPWSSGWIKDVKADSEYISVKVFCIAVSQKIIYEGHLEMMWSHHICSNFVIFTLNTKQLLA